MNWINKTKSFNRDHIFDTGQIIILVIFILLFLICLILRIKSSYHLPEEENLISTKQTNNNDIKEYNYNAYKAWLEGLIFISNCFIISWSTGVLNATFFNP